MFCVTHVFSVRNAISQVDVLDVGSGGVVLNVTKRVVNRQLIG